MKSTLARLITATENYTELRVCLAILAASRPDGRFEDATGRALAAFAGVRHDRALEAALALRRRGILLHHPEAGSWAVSDPGLWITTDLPQPQLPVPPSLADALPAVTLPARPPAADPAPLADRVETTAADSAAAAPTPPVAAPAGAAESAAPRPAILGELVQRMRFAVESPESEPEPPIPRFLPRIRRRNPPPQLPLASTSGGTKAKAGAAESAATRLRAAVGERAWASYPEWPAIAARDPAFAHTLLRELETVRSRGQTVSNPSGYLFRIALREGRWPAAPALR